MVDAVASLAPPMIGSDEEGVVRSEDSDGPPPSAPPVRQHCVVVLRADDQLSVAGLTKPTREVAQELGGEASPLRPAETLGVVLVRWSLAPSDQVYHQLAWVREVGSLHTKLRHVSHWIDYSVEAAEWFGEHVLERDRQLDEHRLHGMRAAGEFTVGGAFGQSDTIRIGWLGHLRADQ